MKTTDNSMGSSASMMVIEDNPELTSAIEDEYRRLHDEGYLDFDIEAELKTLFEDKVLEYRKKRAKEALYARIQSANPSLAKVDIKPISMRTDASSVAVNVETQASETKAKKIEDDKKPTRDRNKSISVVQKGNAKSTSRNSRESFSGEGSNNPKILSDSRAKAIVSKSTASKGPIQHENKATLLLESQETANFALPVTCKLLHDGPKLFWRQHVTLDINIYVHESSDCIEIIGFDVDKFKELNRIYLKMSLLIEMTLSEALKRLEARREEAEISGRKKMMPTAEVMLQEANESAVVSHILDRFSHDFC